MAWNRGSADGHVALWVLSRRREVVMSGVVVGLPPLEWIHRACLQQRVPNSMQGRKEKKEGRSGTQSD